MAAKARVIELVDELRGVYEEKRPYYNGPRIRTLYLLIEEHAETYDDHMYIITRLDIVKSGGSRKRPSISKVIEMSDSLERMKAIYPHIPYTWEEKRTILHEMVELTKDKKELVELLTEFQIL